MDIRHVLSENKGVMALIVMILMVVFLSCAALAIDMGFGFWARNQLHDVTDAAALAATRVLGKIYNDLLTYKDYTLTSQDIQDITDAVTEVAGENTVGGKAITISGGDIRIGRWDSSTRTLTQTNTEATAVEVTANSSISTFFARVMGINTLSVTSVAQRQGGMWTGQERPTAALTGVGKVDPGKLNIPVGISAARFNTPYCDQPIIFYPSNDPSSCGGLTAFSTVGQPTPNDIHDVIKEIYDGNNPAPGVDAGTSYFQFTGGTQANLMCPPNQKNLKGDTFQELYNYFRDKDDDGNDSTWTTLVSVYNTNSCANPNGAYQIVGFATVVITGVNCPNGPLEGTVKCKLVEAETRGGGSSYGTLGEIPGLVK